MDYSREIEKKETEKYDPMYYVYYEHMIWPNNCFGSQMQCEEQDFSSIESLVKWIVRMENETDEFRILYIKKMSSLNDRDWKALNTLHEQEVEAYKQNQEKVIRVLEERRKKEEQLAKERKEKEEKEEYERLKAKFENV
jgi:hypothetical protein